MSDLLKYHQWCISDQVAMAAYSKAIRRWVRPGDVVADLGAGTGILGLEACAAGAARVYAIDPSEIIALTPDIARANGFADRIIVRKMSSFDFDPPEKFDVVLASMQGSAGIGNDLLAIVLDARHRLLKPDGMLIPITLQPSFCPVEIPEWYESRINCWNQPRLGLTFESVRSFAVNQTAIGSVPPASLIAEPQPFNEIHLSTMKTPDALAKLVFTVNRAGVFHALAGWAEVTMAPGVRCSSSPLVKERMPWDQMILPIDSPVPVGEGDRIDAMIRSATVGQTTIFLWDVSVYDTKGHRQGEFRHSTFYGSLLAKHDLAERAMGSTPMLSERGRAKSTVLALCDGKRTVEEIAVHAMSRHRGLLRTIPDALAFTIETLAGLRVDVR